MEDDEEFTFTHGFQLILSESLYYRRRQHRRALLRSLYLAGDVPMNVSSEP
ncbi:MAG: hypothetical protein PHN90_08180 [Methanothrix sp.]|nr:hypothetical protein [Methanothrix sp.]NLX38455.1 hypothetical protein [Methanothrix sp.]HNR56948.1 hypothetical protein [Methanothrix sp.]HNT71573.1 hypothetical protein [Methanothrix sp.]HOI68597.1 hypothetical protein [Methanothrix sp.]